MYKILNKTPNTKKETSFFLVRFFILLFLILPTTSHAFSISGTARSFTSIFTNYNREILIPASKELSFYLKSYQDNVYALVASSNQIASPTALEEAPTSQTPSTPQKLAQATSTSSTSLRSVPSDSEESSASAITIQDSTAISESRLLSLLTKLLQKPEIISTLKGEDGRDGVNGTNGKDGTSNVNAPSPYNFGSTAPSAPYNSSPIGFLGGFAALGAQDFTTTTLHATGTSTLANLIVTGGSTLSGDLTVSGTITGAIAGTINPSFTLGSVPFQGATGLTEDNTNLFWDDTNNRLGVGTATPTEALEVNGNFLVAPSGVQKLKVNTSGVQLTATVDFMKSTGDEVVGSVTTYSGASILSLYGGVGKHLELGANNTVRVLRIENDNTGEVMRLKGGLVGIATTSPDRLLHVESSDAVTNAVTFAQRLSHISSGTVATSFGTGIEYELENASGTNRVAGTEEFTWSDATNASEDATYTLKLMRAGTLTTGLTMLSSGAASFAGGVTALYSSGFILDGSVGSIKGASIGSGIDYNVSYSYFNGHIFKTTSGTPYNTIAYDVTNLRSTSTYTPSGAGSRYYRPFQVDYTINAAAGAQSGTATGIFLNATETALNSMTHNLIDLQVGGSSKFKVTNIGFLRTAIVGVGMSDNVNPLIWTTSTNTGTYDAAGRNLEFYSYNSSQHSDAAAGAFTFYGSTFTATSGVQNTIRVGKNFSPTSGTAEHSDIYIVPTINQTGGANGITRGIYINPTLTAVADFRALEIANNANFAIYQSGASADNYFAGDVGIATNSPDRLLHAESSDAVTDAVTFAQRLSHITSGTSAVGFGTGTEYELENTSGTNRVAGEESFRWTDATDATEDATYVLRLIRAGTVTNALTVDSLGALTASIATFSDLGTGAVYSNSGLLTNVDPSDINLKNTVNPLTYGLAEILQLQPKTFYYNDDIEKNRLKYGFLAQDVQLIMPDLVHPISKDSTYLGIETSGIYVTMVNAVKELNTKITNIKDDTIAWLADAGNGIEDFFAKKVHTEELCVKKSNGSEVCITGDALEALILNSGQSPSGSSGSTSDNSNTTEVPADAQGSGEAMPTDMDNSGEAEEESPEIEFIEGGALPETPIEDVPVKVEEEAIPADVDNSSEAIPEPTPVETSEPTVEI